jgi:hypothetical protein
MVRTAAETTLYGTRLSEDDTIDGATFFKARIRRIGCMVKSLGFRVWSLGFRV